jgi:pimeloyl-ACP methyl ester carboxylesterase
MLPLAAAGYHVVAPDQRGYGRTTGWDERYDGDVASFRPLNLVQDTLALVSALGYRSAAAVVGHDFGSPVAAWCALTRPDVFRSVVLMSAPFAGPPVPPANRTIDRIHDELAALARPRKHYQWYYSTREADGDMRNCPQGVHAFLRAYYHYKSADWKQNRPYVLKSWSAAELAKLPDYYVMDLAKDMAETVAPQAPSATARSTSATDSRADCSGIAARPASASRPNSKLLRAAASTSLRASSRARAIGGPTSGRVPWRKCAAPAPG